MMFKRKAKGKRTQPPTKPDLSVIGARGMNNEEIMKHLREVIEKQMAAGQASQETIFMFLQLQILDKLDTINNNILDVESAVNDLNPRKGEY